MPHEEERSPGQAKRPQEAGREKWRRRLWEEGGEGRDPEPKEQGEIPCRSPPSPPTSPQVLNTAASQEAQNWKQFQLITLGGGQALCYASPCPMRGLRAEVRRSSLMEGGGWFSSKRTSSTTTTRDLHCTLFTRGHRHNYRRTGQLRVQPQLSGCGERSPEGVGEGWYIYIYIYNSDSLYKVGEEKKGRGNPAWSPQQTLWFEPPSHRPPASSRRLGWFTSHWSMCSWEWQNTESAADSWHPVLPPWLHSGPPAARAGSSTLPWSTPPELC